LRAERTSGGSKKFVQQGRSHFCAQSVLPVREHGKMARTPLAAFFNSPLQAQNIGWYAIGLGSIASPGFSFEVVQRYISLVGIRLSFKLSIGDEPMDKLFLGGET
jgi:hypothetical protein